MNQDAQCAVLNRTGTALCSAQMHWGRVSDGMCLAMSKVLSPQDVFLALTSRLDVWFWLRGHLWAVSTCLDEDNINLQAMSLLVHLTYTDREKKVCLEENNPQAFLSYSAHFPKGEVAVIQWKPTFVCMKKNESIWYNINQNRKMTANVNWLGRGQWNWKSFHTTFSWP